jgi:hypothetical protein
MLLLVTNSVVFRECGRACCDEGAMRRMFKFLLKRLSYPGSQVLPNIGLIFKEIF